MVLVFSGFHWEVLCVGRWKCVARNHIASDLRSSSSIVFSRLDKGSPLYTPNERGENR